MKSKRGLENKFFLLIPVALLILIGVLAYVNLFSKPGFNCGDETSYGECSVNKPYYCQKGNIVENSLDCGCPEGKEINGSSCTSDFNQNPKTINLKYRLDGTEKSISFVVYEDAYQYFGKLSRQIHYSGNETPSREDFKIKIINQSVQRELLLSLVVEIQNTADNKEDQARIATSIVQNILWGESNKTTRFGSQNIAYTRYPYEVLYEMEGLCGEKSELLAFLLKELGFETTIFYNHAENHESVGIKCSSNDWKDTGYCFVETSGPAIISDNTLAYSGGVKLQSMPEVLKISEGKSLGRISEQGDAKAMMKIRKSIEETGKLNFYYQWKYNKLKEKYGLDGEYQIG